MLPIDLVSGNEISARNIPMLRRFRGTWDDRAITDRYYEEIERLRRFELNIKQPGYQKTNDYDANFRLMRIAKRTKSEIRKLRKIKKRLEASGQSVEDINKRIYEKQVRFLKVAGGLEFPFPL